MATSNQVSYSLAPIIPLDGCLSFVALRFQSVRCGKFPIPMWLKAESTRMPFTRFPDRCTTGGTTHGVYLLHGEFLGFHFSLRLPARAMAQPAGRKPPVLFG